MDQWLNMTSKPQEVAIRKNVTAALRIESGVLAQSYQIPLNYGHPPKASFVVDYYVQLQLKLVYTY